MIPGIIKPGRALPKPGQFGGDLPHLKARKDLSDDFKRKMLYDNPVRFYRFSEGDIAAARNAKGN